MKNKIYVSIVAVAIALFSSNVSMAAFPVKRDAAKTEVTKQQPAQTEELSTSTATTETELTTTTTETKVVKKHSFFTRLFNKIEKVKHAAISQAAYIVLAIFFLGWLGMGINDNFEGFDWVLSLILYLLFWLPGFIYTLIMMGNYY